MTELDRPTRICIQEVDWKPYVNPDVDAKGIYVKGSLLEEGENVGFYVYPDPAPDVLFEALVDVKSSPDPYIWVLSAGKDVEGNPICYVADRNVWEEQARVQAAERVIRNMLTKNRIVGFAFGAFVGFVGSYFFWRKG